MPQLPQLALVVESTHAVGKLAGQPIKFPLQVTSQVPEEHAALPFGSPGQTLPHVPQLLVSFDPSTHMVLSGLQHRGWVPPHGVLHPPQLAMSVDVFVQPPGEQYVWPLAGGHTQALAWQVAAPKHTLPQLPQLFLSVLGVVQPVPGQ